MRVYSHLKPFLIVLVALNVGCIVKANARDTTLVTKISSLDTTDKVLAVQSHSWSLLETGWLLQKQYNGAGNSAKLSGEQIFNNQGHLLRSEVLDSAGRVQTRRDLSYDEKGQLILLNLFNSSANPKQTFIYYTLRSDGQASEVKATDSNGSVLSLLINSYNIQNQIVKADEKRNGGLYQSVLHFWSPDGRVDTLVTLLGNGLDTAEVRIKEFNSDAKIIREFVSVRLPDKSWFARETQTIYDSLGRVIRENNFNGNHIPVGHIVYTLENVSLTPVSIFLPTLRKRSVANLKDGMFFRVPNGNWILGRRPLFLRR